MALETCPRAIQISILLSLVAALVGALRKQRHHNHQVGKGKEPLIRVDPRSLGGPSNESQVARLGEIVDMLDANSRQSGNFRIGENLLARLHGNHGLAPRFGSQFSFSFPWML